MLESHDFSGKTVFVAGGTSGINLEIAARFARAGARTAVVSRNAERVADAEAALKVLNPENRGFICDVRDHAALEKVAAETAEALGPFDVVVSGAAGNFIADAAALSPNGFKTVIDIDLLGTFNVFHATLPYLRTPGASLIAISAPQGSRPQQGQIHVCAAKAGVNMVVKCLALEWGRLGIRVNGISPGLIGDTEGQKRLFPTEESEARFIDDLPLQRLGRKADIADAALFLSSAAASFITGVILDCDGGNALAAGGHSFRS